MTDRQNESLSPNQLALLKIRELKAELAEAKRAGVVEPSAVAGNDGVSGKKDDFEPLAIVSMACRFPRRANTPEKFWQSLIEQTDEVSEIPEDRWDLEAFHDDDPGIPGKMYARKGVFLDQVDQMDPEFFGISPREATWVDPQQRLLMEVGWEALERAGWVPEQIGETTGIFVGWMHNDYQNEASDSFLNLNPYIATGAAGSFLCGRLAYHLGLQGPSLAVDTACSSSLVALHLACQSLQRGDCDRALVGGVNAICSPTTNILTCKLQALSPSGHSRAFDAAADGYLRGEGCGVVTVRRLRDARRDGDQILGVIRGAAIGHNGSSNGLTVPNPRAQEKVIRQAIARADVSPQDVAYLEAHGTGTALGDPIEMKAAAAALTEQRTKENPLLVGSVKTNIGHLEAAAGMAGLIKVLLAIQNDAIPGQMNFETPNPHIDWEHIPVKVLTGATPWPHPEKRIAGVSAFGMSGTNAHVVIEAPDVSTRSESAIPVSSSVKEEDAAGKSAPNEEVGDNDLNLIVVSANDAEALQQTAENLATALTQDPPRSLRDVAYTCALRRKHFDHRAAIVVRDHDDAKSKLEQLARGGAADALLTGVARQRPKIAWQFTGQGSQYVGMGKQLYQSESVFRDVIDRCEERLLEWGHGSLKEVLYGDDERIHNTYWTQPCIFAVQWGLVTLLNRFGLQPDVVLGHSVGQYAAACTAGVMSWDDGLRMISQRGRMISELPSGGTMLAVFAPLDEVTARLKSTESVSLAADNGTHVVISGPETAVESIEAQYANEGRVRTKRLSTSHAFHSALMDPILDAFAEFAREINFARPSVPLICNGDARPLAPDAILEGRDWAQHIRQPVRYRESIEAVQELGCEMLLEVGPKAVLTRMASANWKKSSQSLVSVLQEDIDDSQSLLSAVGKLYVQGVQPRLEVLFEGKNPQAVSLPTYPFQRRRFWGPDKPRAAHADHHTSHPTLGGKVSLAGLSNESRYESVLGPSSPAWLPDHEVMGQVVVPGAMFVEMALSVAGAKQVEELTFEQPLSPNARTTMQTVVRAGDDSAPTIESFSSPEGQSLWQRNFTAKISDPLPSREDQVNLEAIKKRCLETATPSDFYDKMREIGLNYGPQFQAIVELYQSPTEVLTRLKTQADIRGFVVPPPLLDGAFHSLAAQLLQNDEGDLFLPMGMKRVGCLVPSNSDAWNSDVWCHASWNQSDGKVRTADLTLFDGDGKILLVIEELRVQQVSRAALRKMSRPGPESLLYETRWQKNRLPSATTDSKHWLLIHEDNDFQRDFSARLSSRLRERGHRVCLLSLKVGSPLDSFDPESFQMDGSVSENWERLWEQVSPPSEQAGVPDGIAWLVHDPKHANEASLDESTGLLSGIPAQTQRHCQCLLAMVHSLQRGEYRSVECGIQMVTADAIVPDGGSPCVPDQTQYWGLGRVLGAEQPEYRWRMIDLASSEVDAVSTVDAVTEVFLTETQDNQFAIRDGQFWVPRMRAASVTEENSREWTVRSGRSYLITGGMGMLGRQAAKWLADQGASEVVLVSRRQPDEATRMFFDEIEAAGCQVIVHAADMGSRVDVEEMFLNFGDSWAPLAGVIHAAGVLDDALIGEQTWERFEQVLSPKVVGASLLHELTKSLPIDFFILYSSAASVLGSPGQSNYATANAFLDGLAWHRRSLGLPAMSVNWGPWTEGMADDERIVKRLSLQGITPLAAGDAHRAMEKMHSAGHLQTLVMDVDWRRMRMGLGGDSPLIEGLVPARTQTQTGDSELVGKLKQLRGPARRELLFQTVQTSLQRILSTEEAPAPDRPLVEMGLDSLMAVEFGTELQQMLGDSYAVGPTMLFDHPSVDAITDHVLELIAETSDGDSAESKESGGEAVASAANEQVPHEPIAIVGMSCRFPGAKNLEQFWGNLMSGVDSVGEIPSDRWDVDRFYSADRAPGKMYTRQGGFVDDIAEFDPAFFNISEQEACWIDPQHRMLLENSYLALEDAGIASHPLKDSNVGVFMGIMGQDYAFLPELDNQEIIEAFQGAGLSHSAGVGRISYVFGFEGPSIAVDTASSSSLVALHQAVRSLQEGDCNMALAGGVNAILAPVNSLLMSKAGLLAPDGRCKSFSADADGFGRGEGCGVVVLKRLSDAQRDNDRIMAVVRGGAVVHNGFSSGITSPSGKSQSRAITEALANAEVSASQVQYLEAHGTGTEYGDPMELGAAASVYGRGRRRDNPLLVGSVKANISHLEAAGGVSGLIKTVLSLHRGVIPPQAHFDTPSPHIPWKRLPLKMVTEPTPWPESSERLAGLTALGLVGTNAHIILSSAPTDTPTSDAPLLETELPKTTGSTLSENDDVGAANLLTISARTPQALKQLVERYQTWLSDHPDLRLKDVCHTAATGRRHYEYRLGLTVESTDDAVEQLNVVRGMVADQRVSKVSSDVPKTGWIFTGDGEDTFEIARELYHAEPRFRFWVDQWDQQLKADGELDNPLGLDLSAWLDSGASDDQGQSPANSNVASESPDSESPDSESSESEIPGIDAHEVLLFVLQAGIAKLWEHWGMKPDAVVGWGVGQYTASCVAGGLSYEDAVRLVARSALLRRRTDVGQGMSDVNSHHDAFEAFADTLNYYPPSIPLVCSLSGDWVPVHRSLGGKYWRDHLQGSMMREEALETFAETTYDFVVEIGPKPSLAQWVDQQNVGENTVYLPCSTSPASNMNQRPVMTTMLGSLGRWYEAGGTPDFGQLFGFVPQQRMSLPQYPFQKKRYWITEVARYNETGQHDEAMPHQAAQRSEV